MSKNRNLADLLDSTGDVKSTSLDNVPAADVVNDTTPQLGGNLDTNGNNVNFGDNDKAQFGASNDLQIYHDGSNSIINETGTGVLEVRTNGTEVQLTGNSGAEYMLRALSNGAVNLYYDNSKKLATTSTGVSVTGNVTADGLNVYSGTANTVANFTSTDIGAYLNISDQYQTGRLNSTGSTFKVEADPDNLYASTALIFTTDGSERMRIDSSGNLKFNSGYGSAATAYGVRAWVQFNGSGTVSINQSGNVSSITDQGTGYYQVNFSSALPDAQYAVSMAGRRVNSNGDVATAIRGTTDGGTVYNSSAFNWTAKTATGHSPIDLDIACVQVVR